MEILIWRTWIKKKEHFFHNKLTTNNLIIQSFPMTIFYLNSQTTGVVLNCLLQEFFL